MDFQHLLRDYLRSESGKDYAHSSWIEILLEYRAKERDNALRNQLLKELVFKYAAAEKELLRLNLELMEKQRRLNEDLKAAAGIQSSLLPSTSLDFDNLKASWKFLPCELIGGDIFNLVQLDEDHVGIYMIDVSGHGVSSALVTVSVSQVLHLDSGLLRQNARDGSYEIVSPQAVLNALEEQYPMERFDMFFTIVYAVLNVRDGSFRYSKAGHPPPILVRKEGGLEVLDKNGPVIGMGGFVPYEQDRKDLKNGDKIIIYTDGVVEYENPQGDFFGKERLRKVLGESTDLPIDEVLDRVIEAMLAFGNRCPPQDDVSLLGIEYLS